MMIPRGEMDEEKDYSFNTVSWQHVLAHGDANPETCQQNIQTSFSLLEALALRVLSPEPTIEVRAKSISMLACPLRLNLYFTILGYC
jgi:hypothetical protein